MKRTAGVVAALAAAALIALPATTAEATEAATDGAPTAKAFDVSNAEPQPYTALDTNWGG